MPNGVFETYWKVWKHGDTKGGLYWGRQDETQSMQSLASIGIYFYSLHNGVFLLSSYPSFSQTSPPPAASVTSE